MNTAFFLIKPDAVSAGYTRRILDYLEKSGFEVLMQKQETLSREDVAFLYPMHVHQDFFDDLVAFMTSGPSELCVVRKEAAVEALNELVGVTDPQSNHHGSTLRNEFGTNLRRNAVHSPNSWENSVRELLYFFHGTTVI